MVKPPNTRERESCDAGQRETGWRAGGAGELRHTGQAMDRTTETNPPLDAVLWGLFDPTCWSSKGRRWVREEVRRLESYYPNLQRTRPGPRGAQGRRLRSGSMPGFATIYRLGRVLRRNPLRVV